MARDKSADIGQAILLSQFTANSIHIDGIAEPAWDSAQPSRIWIAMTCSLSAPAQDCTTCGDVRSLWDGAPMYMLIDVTDADITTAARKTTNKDGVEIYFDFFNDKFLKYEGDDGIMRISSDGELSGNGVYAERLEAYAAAPRYDGKKKSAILLNLPFTWVVSQ